MKARRPGTRIALVAAVVALALTSVGAVLAVRSYRDSRGRAIKDLQTRVQTVQSDTRQFVSTHFATLADLADNPQLASADPLEIQRSLRDLPVAQTGFPGGFAWADGSGRLRVASTKGRPAAAAPPLDVVRRVLRTGSPAISSTVRSPAFAGPAILFAVPTRDNLGHVRGALVGAIPIDWLSKTSAAYPLSPGSTLSIVDRAGNLVAAPGLTKPTATTLMPLVQRARATTTAAQPAIGSAEHVVGRGLLGAPNRIVAWATEPTSGWTLFVERPTGLAWSAAKRALLYELIALIAVAAVGVVPILWLGRRFDRIVEAQRRAKDTAERRQERAEVLQRFSEAIARATGVEAVRDAFLRAAVAVFDTDKVVLITSDRAGTEAPRSAGERSSDRIVEKAGRLLAKEAIRRSAGIWLEGRQDIETELPRLARSTPTIASGVAVPLVVGGWTLGAIAYASDFERTVSEEERAFQLAFAAHGAQGLERARLYEQEHEIGIELQKALLPESLPGGPLSVAAIYRPGESHLTIGGDWYDVIALPDGRLVLVVGDIVGHGLRAAVAMGKMRTAIAALVTVAEGPAELIARLEAFALQVEGARYATVACAYLDPATGVLRSASAGHPPLIVVDPCAGASYVWGGRSGPLCSNIGSSRSEDTRVLGPRTTILLYTDGLFELRHLPGELWLDALLREAEETVALETEPIDAVNLLVERMLAGAQQQDDIAVVTARLDEALQPAIVIQLEADPAQLSTLRRQLRTWLADHGASEQEQADLVLAVHEAAANAMEHAYNGAPATGDEFVVVEASARNGETQVAVRDTGRWREGQSLPQRGRGLLLIDRLTDELTVQRESTGTTVSIRHTLQHAEGAVERAGQRVIAGLDPA